jgi:hypothetical protein
MELGLLLTGGRHPALVEQHFAGLIDDKVLTRLEP